MEHSPSFGMRSKVHREVEELEYTNIFEKGKRSKAPSVLNVFKWDQFRCSTGQLWGYGVGIPN